MTEPPQGGVLVGEGSVEDLFIDDGDRGNAHAGPRFRLFGDLRI
ncbi:hypothetical protein [Aquamicrobium zhengzhouense]